MFATHSPRHFTVMACVLAAALLGPSAAFAQEQTFMRSKPHVNASWSVREDVPLSFTIDMAQSSVGRTIGIFSIDQVPHENNRSRVQGEHSSIQATLDGLTATFGMRLQQQTADGPLDLGTLTVQGQAAGRPAGGGGGGDIVVFDIIDSVTLDSTAAGGKGLSGVGF